MNKVIGIVLRYKDKMLSDKSDTILEHNKIFDEYKKVFFGKVGKYIGANTVKICNDNKIEKYLLLVTNKHGYLFHAAKIESAQTERPPLHLIPEYYRNSKDIKSWICINSPLMKLDEVEINNWVIKSTGMSIASSLSSSMAAYFLAVRKSPIAN